MTSPGTVAALSMFVSVERGFRELLAWLRTLPMVTQTSYRCWLIDRSRAAFGDEPSASTDVIGIEWYSDGELEDGRALSLGLSAEWTGSDWLVEPSILVNSGTGQDDLLDLPSTYAVEDIELVKELEQAVAVLKGSRDEIYKRLNSSPSRAS
jgi:hypothetical protein